MVTGRCNYKCFFCHMEGYREGEVEELTLEEIRLLSEAGRRIGIKSYKITGGEPTLRRDLPEIALLLGQHALVSITTNASLLHLHLKKLSETRISHMNISLHSLREERFRLITGYSNLSRILENTKQASQLFPIKINIVVLKGLNEDEIEDFVELAAKLNAKLQFIELHPVGRAKSIAFQKHHLPWFYVLERLKNRVTKINYRYGLHNRPILVLDNGIEVELVGPVGNPVFCAACTRIRITYDFKIVPCLNWSGPLIDLRGAIQNIDSKEAAVERIVEALAKAVETRRPYYLWSIKTNTAPAKRPWRTARLGLPKKRARLSFTGSRAEKHLQLYLSEWDY